MSRFIRGTAIGAGLLLASIGQGYAQEDTTPPQLLDLIINTPVIDTSTSNATVVLTALVSDDLSGVKTVASAVRFPNGNIEPVFCSLTNMFTPITGVWRCNRLIPQFAAFGVYELIRMELVDNASNTFIPNTAALEAMGFPTTFQNADLGGQPDFDNDGVPDAVDNCPDDPNPGQEDRDLDGIGDVCDPFPDDPPGEPLPDVDFDGVADLFDNCPDDPNGDQADVDGDRVGDVCDNCVPLPNRDQKDEDDNGIGDVCDALDEFIGPIGGDVSRAEFEALKSEVSSLQSAINELDARIAALKALGLSEEIQALKDDAAALEERLSKIEAIKQIEKWLGKKPK